MERIIGKIYLKNKNSSIVPSAIFSSKLSKVNSMTHEKNTEQNLTKMVKLVKLKKKILEVMRFFLKSSYYKSFL